MDNDFARTAGVVLIIGGISAVLLALAKGPWAVHIRRWFLESKARIVAALGFLIIAVLYIFRSKQPMMDRAHSQDVALQKKLADARIDAALQIGRAQGKEEQVKAELEQITAVSDKEEQLKQLAQLVQRTRRK